MAKDLTKLYSRPGAEAFHVFEDDNGRVQVKMGDRTAVTAVPSGPRLALQAGGALIGIRSPGVGGAHKLVSSTPYAAGAGYSFVMQWGAPAPFSGVQLGFINLGTAPYSVNGLKIAVPTVDLDGGAGLTWIDATFDNGVSAGTTPKVIPAGSGATVDAVPGNLVLTDIIPVSSLVRTDDPAKSRLLQSRTYLAGASTTIQTAGTWSGLRADTGLDYASGVTVGDKVTTTTDALLPVIAGNWIMPQVVRFIYDVPAVQVVSIGDSLVRGQGSTSGYRSAEAIACQSLTSASGVFALTNFGISGQHIAASFATAVAICNSSWAPDVLVWKACSPNDGYSQAALDAAFAYTLRVIDLCKSKRIGLVIRNGQRWNQDATATARLTAFNARLAALSNVLISDDYAVLSAGAPDPYKNNLAYTVSPSDQHLSDAGYEAVSRALVPLLQAAAV